MRAPVCSPTSVQGLPVAGPREQRRITVVAATLSVVLAAYVIAFAILAALGRSGVPGTRTRSLMHCLEGYKRTGVPLVAFDGSSLSPCAYTEDVGMYYLATRIADLFGLPAVRAANLLFAGILAAALVGGILSIRSLCTGRARWIAGLYLVALIGISDLISGIHVVVPAVTVLVILPFLALERSPEKRRWLGLALLIDGLLIGTAHFVRLNAGVPALIFIVIAVLWSGGRTARTRVKLLGLTLVGLLVSSVFFTLVLANRNSYLADRLPQYRYPPGHHLVWHTVYIGFGFLSNPYGIEYKDEVAYAAALAENPRAEFPYSEYDAALKKQVLRLVHSHPYFVARTIAAKFGVIAVYFLLAANIGLMRRYRLARPRITEIAFRASLLASALAAVAAVPIPSYLLGHIAVAALYAIDGIVRSGGVEAGSTPSAQPV